MSAPERRPLERITLAGYKSIRKLDAFPLNSGLNVLIGANGSGKTNFIRFFELLGNIMNPNKGLQNYVSARGGAEVFLFRGMKMTPEFQAELKFGSNEYRFSLKAADDRSLFLLKNRVFELMRMWNTTEGTGHKESGFFRKGWTDETVQVDKKFIRGIQNLRVYHFHDTSPSAPVMGRCNTVDCDVLHGNASNLAAFLMRMAQTHPTHYAQIEETVRQVAPFFGAFVLKEVAPGQTQLLWKDRYSDLLYYPHQLSDGTLRYICLAALLLQPNPPATIIIDEPELGLHPFAIKLLASLLHEAAGRTQLIVSTQSSLLVDEFTPEEVIVVNHRDGETLFERLDRRAWPIG